MPGKRHSILVVEDEPVVAEVVERYLLREGHDVCVVRDGLAALDAFAERAPDLIVLDLMLPGLDSIEVCRRVRASSQTPIIMPTARGEESDKLLGLDEGADNYLTKPFSPRELVARVSAAPVDFDAVEAQRARLDGAGRAAQHGVVTTFFSLWLAATLTGRVREIAATIRELARGRYDARLITAGGDEIAALASDVDLLAARLDEAERQRRRLDDERRELTAAISHDLRTPLASIQAMAEALRDGVVSEPAEADRYYEAMSREIERLGGMINDLFELARIDAGVLELDRREVLLQEIATDVVDAMQAQARRGEVTLELAVAGAPPPAPLDGARIERAIANLAPVLALT